MVDSIAGLARAISTLRLRLAAGTLQSGPAQRGAARPPPDRREESIGQEPSHVANLAVRLAALTGPEPERSRRKLRMFLEAVLLDEFGSRHALAPEFQDLVERVANAVESEAGMAETVQAAMGELDVTVGG